MNALGKNLLTVLVLVVASGLAHAQRSTVVGVKGERKSVAAFADAAGRTPVEAVPASALGGRPSVLETSVDDSLVRVRVGDRELWLDRNALQLSAGVNAACTEVASAHGAAQTGAPRGANSACPLPLKTGGR